MLLLLVNQFIYNEVFPVGGHFVVPTVLGLVIRIRVVRTRLELASSTGPLRSGHELQTCWIVELVKTWLNCG